MSYAVEAGRKWTNHRDCASATCDSAWMIKRPLFSARRFRRIERVILNRFLPTPLEMFTSRLERRFIANALQHDRSFAIDAHHRRRGQIVTPDPEQALVTVAGQEHLRVHQPAT